MLDGQAISNGVERELASILLQSVKVAEKEGKSEVKEALILILGVIQSRRDKREKDQGSI